MMYVDEQRNGRKCTSERIVYLNVGNADKQEPFIFTLLYRTPVRYHAPAQQDG
jgi:hypothetical protein